MSDMASLKLKISKLDAAQRQLDVAIQLWFLDGDELAIHTLAAAAYQLVHDLKEHRGIEKSLLYDAKMIKDEHRKKWIAVVKKPANFLKHANNDPEGTLEFHPLETLAIIMAAASGLRFLGAQTSGTVGALTFWLVINKPNWVTEHFLKLYEERVGIENLQEFKLVPKRDFLQLYLSSSNTARQLAADAGIPLG
jgi:hypothetical protein